MRVTAADIQTSMSKGPTIIDFWAPWCNPCKAINRELEDIRKRRPEVSVIKVNVDDHPELVSAYAVKSVPYIIYTTAPGAAPRSLNGFISAEDLIRRIYPMHAGK